MARLLLQKIGKRFDVFKAIDRNAGNAAVRVRDEGEEEIPDEVKDTWLYKIRVIRAAIPAIRVTGPAALCGARRAPISSCAIRSIS